MVPTHPGRASARSRQPPGSKRRDGAAARHVNLGVLELRDLPKPMSPPAPHPTAGGRAPGLSIAAAPCREAQGRWCGVADRSRSSRTPRSVGDANTTTLLPRNRVLQVLVGPRLARLRVGIRPVSLRSTTWLRAFALLAATGRLPLLPPLPADGTCHVPASPSAAAAPRAEAARGDPTLPPCVPGERRTTRRCALEPDRETRGGWGEPWPPQCGEGTYLEAESRGVSMRPTEALRAPALPPPKPGFTGPSRKRETNASRHPRRALGAPSYPTPTERAL